MRGTLGKRFRSVSVASTLIFRASGVNGRNDIHTFETTTHCLVVVSKLPREDIKKDLTVNNKQLVLGTPSICCVFTRSVAPSPLLCSDHEISVFISTCLSLASLADS